MKIPLSTFEEIIQKWLFELRKELKDIDDFEKGKSVDGIDDVGYCTGILSYGQSAIKYREQLKGAIYFITKFFNMK